MISVKYYLGMGYVVLAALPTSALAQNSADKPIDQHIAAMANVYGVTTYALGANNVCDIFTQGQMRALTILADAAGDELEAEVGFKNKEAINKSSAGYDQWKGCLTRAGNPAPWKLIDNAQILASALIAAPAIMTGDPNECKISGEGRALDRAHWQRAADIMAARYRASPRKAEFETQQRYFAAQLGDECSYSRQGSVMMQAGFEFLRETDETIKAMNFFAPHLPKTKLTVQGNDSAETPAEHLPWRSRRGDFVPSHIPVKFGIYRMAGSGDKKAVSILLMQQNTNAPAGYLFVSKQGKWSARLNGNIPAMRIQLTSGGFIPMTKTVPSKKADPVMSEFYLPAGSQSPLDTARASTLVAAQYQDNTGSWNSFAPFERGNAGEPLRIVDIRTALAWVNAPLTEQGMKGKNE